MTVAFEPVFEKCARDGCALMVTGPFDDVEMLAGDANRDWAREFKPRCEGFGSGNDGVLQIVNSRLETA